MSPSAVHVADNPVIDQDWYAGEMSALTTKLATAFPHVAPETIDVAIELATQRIAVSARIPNYLPVLIDRDVRAQLATYGETVQAPLPPVTPVPAPAAAPPVIVPAVAVAPPNVDVTPVAPVYPPAF